MCYDPFSIRAVSGTRDCLSASTDLLMQRMPSCLKVRPKINPSCEPPSEIPHVGHVQDVSQRPTIRYPYLDEIAPREDFTRSCLDTRWSAMYRYHLVARSSELLENSCVRRSENPDWCSFRRSSRDSSS